MTGAQPSEEALSILHDIAQLSDGFKNGQQGSREGLLGAAAKLLNELSHPSETMLNLLWAQPSHHTIIRTGIEMKLFEALSAGGKAGQTSAEIAARCDHQADPVLVGMLLRWRIVIEF